MPIRRRHPALARLAPMALLAPLAAQLLACDLVRVKRGGDSASATARSAVATAGASAAATDSAAGMLAADEAPSFALDSLERNDETTTAALRADTSWRATAEAYRRRLDSAGASAPRGATPHATPGAAPDGPVPAPPPALPALPDSVPPAAPTPIAPEAVNRPSDEPVLGGDGAAVLRAQILLDQAGYSPGAIDGTWGGNTGKAAYWYQFANRLPVTGAVDSATLADLSRRAGRRRAVRPYTVTEGDVAGPFAPLPASPYEQARLDCLCYESAWEELAERFHATKALLARLNPTADTTRLTAGTVLWVPDVERPHVVPLVSSPRLAKLANTTSLAAVAQQAGTDSAARRPTTGAAAAAPTASTASDTLPRLVAQPQVARIVVARRGGYLHALDAQGRILAHMPNTVGASFDPTPGAGQFHVTRVVFYPTFRYDPRLYADVSDARPGALLPAGPNSAVGVAWIALSKPHYGIHGTQSPSTIGYEGSHGCVRLTNWDARWLAEHTPVGTEVEFVE